METLSTIQQAVQLGDWLVSIDRLKRCLLSRAHRRVLQIPPACSRARASSVHLPPLLSLNLTSGVLESSSGCGSPHQKEAYTYTIIANLLLPSQDRKQLLRHRAQVISTLVAFGWLLNLEKSHLEPTQGFVYLGAQFNKVEYTISLSLEEKIPVVWNRVRLALASSCLRGQS